MTDQDQRKPFMTTIRVEPINDGWTATEPDGEQNVWGHGEGPREAVIDYIEALE
jgi:hypothetical protein